MTDQTVTQNSGADVKSAAARIDAIFSQQTAPEVAPEAQTSPEPVETDAEPNGDVTHVLQPDEAEDTDEVSQETKAEANADAEESDGQADSEPEAEPTEDYEVPETLSDLAAALEVEDLSNLRVKAKVNGEEVEVPIAEAVRGYQRQQDYDAKMSEVRSERDKFDQAVDQATKTWQSKFATLDGLVQDLQAQVAGQEPNWENVLDTYGGDEMQRQKLMWDQKQAVLQRAQAERQRVEQERGQQSEAQKREWAENERNRLLAAWPELGDSKKSESVVKEMQQYLTEAGYSADELADMLDHRQYLIVRDAMRYRGLEASKPEAKKKVKGLPKVLKANAPKGKDTIQRDKVTSMSRKLRNTGSVDDAASIFKEMGI